MKEECKKKALASGTLLLGDAIENAIVMVKWSGNDWTIFTEDGRFDGYNTLAPQVGCRVIDAALLDDDLYGRDIADIMGNFQRDRNVETLLAEMLKYGATLERSENDWLTDVGDWILSHRVGVCL